MLSAALLASTGELAATAKPLSAIRCYPRAIPAIRYEAIRTEAIPLPASSYAYAQGYPKLSAADALLLAFFLLRSTFPFLWWS